MSRSLEAELFAHLDAQIGSAQKLLGLVLGQGAAIKARDVEKVLKHLSDIQTEMGRRGQLEEQRSQLLRDSGATLGVPGAAVTLEQLCTLLSEQGGELARARSAELRGLLAEIAREHGINRALMRQELAFLSHLTGLLGQESHQAYGESGQVASTTPNNTINAVDLRA